MTSRFKTIIVDDERLARAKLRSLLSKHPEMHVVGEADSVQQALEAIQSLQPDVVFLDIQMPGETGFELLNRSGGEFKVIFVTAFDEYAIRAFEVNALDYLLKPVNPERLARSLERLSASKEPAENAGGALEYDDHLFLTVENASRFVRVSSIECITADGPYSQIFTSDGKKALVLKPLKEWEARLPEKYFMRIHRSTIINVGYVDRVEKWFNYSYQVHLRGFDSPLIMSRRYGARLKSRLR